MQQVDVAGLPDKVKVMYRAVADTPHGIFHFEMGRALAERLGYPPVQRERVPTEAIDSFAGVGYPLGLAAITAGERIVGLGSGCGLDAFLAARRAGPDGQVIGNAPKPYIGIVTQAGRPVAVRHRCAPSAVSNCRSHPIKGWSRSPATNPEARPPRGET